jgi:putative ABC transport system permease protein
MQILGWNPRQSIRTLSKSKSFTLATVLTIALGIGANTAIFSVVYAALLRPLPYRQPSQLVTMGETRQQQADPGITVASYPDYVDWKRQAKSFQAIGGYSGDAFTFLAEGEPRSIFAAQATPNFFAVLGVRPSLGRDFVDTDLQRDFPQAAILTYALWQSQLHGDPNVIGRSVHLDGKPVTIVGVLPRQFEFAPAGAAELWVPLHPGVDGSTRRSLRWLNVVARLADGVTADRAWAEMKGITAQLARAYPKEDGSLFIAMGSLRDRILGKIRPLLLILFGVVGMVLLITCANVASLLMTRSIGRGKEFAVRAALGASRGNLLAQSLFESLVLSLLGAGVGLAGASRGVGLLIAAIPQSQLQTMPFLLDAGINLPVLVFLCGVTVMTAILFGLAPALTASRLSVNHSLKEETRGGTSGAHVRLRNAFVCTEVAISLILLLGAGLMVKSLRALMGQNPGYDLNHVMTFSVNLPDASYPSEKEYPFDSPSAIRFEHAFTQRLEHLPGVISAAAATAIPATGGSGTIRFLEEGRSVAPGHEDEADILTISTGYFSTLRIPLVSGRFFDAHDGPDAPKTLIVNRAFARAYFPGENAVGKRVRFTFNAKEPFRQIVGVVGDTAENDFADPHLAIVYYPNDQGPSTYLNYLVRTEGEPRLFGSEMRDALHEMDPQVPMIQPAALQDVVSQSPSVFLRLFPSYLIGSFAALALILTVIGLYGLISYTVVQRTREIGIRVTLGAQQRDVLRLIVRQGLVTTVAGLGIGIAGGLALTRLLSTLLFGVKPADWQTFAGVTVLLLLVALAACIIPARRAMRIDPTVALRHG